MASSVVALMEQQQVYQQNYGFISHSLGGTVALLATRISGLTKPAVFISLEGNVLPQDCSPNGFARRAAGKIDNFPRDDILLECQQGDLTGVTCAPPRLLQLLRLSKQVWREWASEIQLLDQFAPRLFASLLQYNESSECLKVLETLPLRYIYGKNSGKFCGDTQRMIEKSHPDAMACGIDGAGHFMLTERPSETISALKEMLSPFLVPNRAAPTWPTSGCEIIYSNVPNRRGVLLDNVAFDKHERTTQTLLGKVVGNARQDNVAAAPWRFGFNLTRSDVPLNNLNALHTHKAAEVFICSSGQFRIHVGGGHTSVLSPGDFALVPAGVERSFECIATSNWCAELGAETANIVTVIPGESWVQWCASTIKSARENGAVCNDFGILHNAVGGAALACGGPRSTDELVPIVTLSQQQLESNIHRAHNSPQLLLPFSDGELRMEVQTRSEAPIHISPLEDAIVVVIEGQIYVEQATEVGADAVPLAVISSDGCYLSPRGHGCTLRPSCTQATSSLVVRSTNTPWEEMVPMPQPQLPAAKL